MKVIIEGVSKEIVMLIPMLIGVAYMTLGERKVLGGMQRRRGPNKVWIEGVGQPIADGIKLMIKEGVKPMRAEGVMYKAGPVVTWMLSMLGWSVVPIGEGEVIVDIEVGIIVWMSIGSLGVYGVIIGGWGSSSQYSIMGGLRSGAQMVSYELGMGVMMICIIIIGGSGNISRIVEVQEGVWNISIMMPVVVMYMGVILAETSRTPFDLPEAEAELVAGYNVEYGGMGFGMYFLAEYGNIILMSVVSSVIMMGGWNSKYMRGELVVGIKSTIIVYVYIWIRGSWCRYRYDQLMRIGWKGVIVYVGGYVIVMGSIMWSIGGVSI
ncbi:NADH dehydrogenase subunit 1 (mitochondrion) [Galdieria partita]|uniref:NADH-ubiquinone oxidoreductase chain 1 n=1 Tax=Galdieria partita TaxID=83374 RepID=A0A9C7EW72_9RHOD|nr:NADH dehydrogenase subunit 1 [Galdieria partita]